MNFGIGFGGKAILYIIVVFATTMSYIMAPGFKTVLDIYKFGRQVSPWLNVLASNWQHWLVALQTSLHGSCPVIKGEKWVVTKWLRDEEQND